MIYNVQLYTSRTSKNDLWQECICLGDFYILPICKWEEPKINNRSNCISIAMRENIAWVKTNDETSISLSETNLRAQIQ